MNISTDQYAELSFHAYDDIKVGVRPPNHEEEVTYKGVDYKILEHANNPRTGYQGTIYQRKDTGEIVVAHRGTESPKKDLQDAITDADMVRHHHNQQVDDAIRLTQHAIERAHNDPRLPPVTVTGHSLGGTLAEITAHKFKLHGETFNPYGAAGLDLHIPEGGTAVINHVLAGDAVSAASPHYGQVRIYATENDVATMQQAGYRTRSNQSLYTAGWQTALPLTQADHGIANFLTHDEQGRPHASVLNAQNLQRAHDHAEMIAHYRHDVTLHRGTIGRLLAQAEMGADTELLAQAGPGRDRLLPEAALLVQHGNPKIAAFHDRVQQEPTLGGYSELERTRIAAACLAQSQRMGLDVAGLTELECYVHQGKGQAFFVADDPAKAARNPYTSNATVNVAVAVQTPVAESLALGQGFQAARHMQEPVQGQGHMANGPVFS
ncbi:hypothetical protein [Brachymonas sp.]|uniref:hypothetical protein n=1 Tax=Brachymonas sp. TaxID=1936292 RepID=UPI0035B28625